MPISSAKLDTALHVLKGAVEKVLRAKTTTGVAENDDFSGRLVVEFDRKPSAEEMEQVQAEANSKVEENAVVENMELDRDEAEAKFGKKIYDKFPVPEHIKTLKIVKIPDWNINCCIGKHLQSTGLLGKIKIDKFRYRGSRNELEISFSLH